MAVRDFIARFLGDDRDLQATMRRVGRGTDTLDKKVGKFAAGARTAFIGVGATAAVAFGRELYELGVQATAMERRFDTVFGSNAGGLARKLDEMNERFGVAEERMKGMAASAGDLFVPMGFTRDVAADMSLEVLRLAGALSEWTGGQRSAQEVTDIVAKAILGEREALKGLGVSITEADVKQRLAENGAAALTGELAKQAKAQATLQLITERSADALTAYAEGGDEATLRGKELAAAIDEIKFAAGDLVIQLAPLVGGLVELIELIRGDLPTVESFESGLRGLAEAGVDYAGWSEKAAAAVDRMDRASEAAGLTMAGMLPTVDALAGGIQGVGEAWENIPDTADRALVRMARELAASAAMLGGVGQRVVDDWNRALRRMEGQASVDAFAESLLQISLEMPVDKVREAADQILSIWSGLPDKLSQVDIEKAIADAVSVQQVRADFEADQRALIDAGFGALVDEINRNPNRSEAIALMGYFAGDMAAAMRFADQLGLNVDAALRIVGDRARAAANNRAYQEGWVAMGQAWARALSSGFQAEFDVERLVQREVYDQLRKLTLRGGSLRL